jgi:hypothetical protein
VIVILIFILVVQSNLQGIPCPKEKRKGKKKGTPNLGKKVGS